MSALLLGRLSGFLRDVYISKTLGVGRSSDFLLAVLQIPDFLVGLLLVGGLNAYLIPKLQSASESGFNYGPYSCPSIVPFYMSRSCFGSFSSFFGAMTVPGLMPFTSEESVSFKIILALMPLAAISGVFSVWLIFREWVFLED